MGMKTLELEGRTYHACMLPAANVPSTLGITPNYGAARTKIPQ